MCHLFEVLSVQVSGCEALEFDDRLDDGFAKSLDETGFAYEVRCRSSFEVECVETERLVGLAELLVVKFADVLIYNQRVGVVFASVPGVVKRHLVSCV